MCDDPGVSWATINPPTKRHGGIDASRQRENDGGLVQQLMPVLMRLDSRLHSRLSRESVRRTRSE